jgi:hypothetical protein
MSRSLPAPPTDPPYPLVLFRGDALSAHANVAIATPESITTGRCMRCVKKKPVWSPPPTNRNHVLATAANHVDPRPRSNLHAMLRLWNGNDRRLTGIDLLRLLERGGYFEGVEWQNREGWASAEEPA